VKAEVVEMVKVLWKHFEESWKRKQTRKRQFYMNNNSETTTLYEAGSKKYSTASTSLVATLHKM